jgi:hypothetical protein
MSFLLSCSPAAYLARRRNKLTGIAREQALLKRRAAAAADAANAKK